ncbi:MAG: hypothetical protein WC174_02180 [Bacilli bacterium]
MEKTIKSDISEKGTFETPAFDSYLDKLQELRQEGENKIIALRNEIRDIKLNKQIDKDTKNKIILKDKTLIEEAKKVLVKNKEKVNKIIKESTAKAEVAGKKVYASSKETKKAAIAEAKTTYSQRIEKERTDHQARLTKLVLPENATKEEIQAHKTDLKAEKILLIQDVVKLVQIEMMQSIKQKLKTIMFILKNMVMKEK